MFKYKENVKLKDKILSEFYGENHVATIEEIYDLSKYVEEFEYIIKLYTRQKFLSKYDYVKHMRVKEDEIEATGTVIEGL